MMNTVNMISVVIGDTAYHAFSKEKMCEKNHVVSSLISGELGELDLECSLPSSRM